MLIGITVVGGDDKPQLIPEQLLGLYRIRRFLREAAVYRKIHVHVQQLLKRIAGIRGGNAHFDVFVPLLVFCEPGRQKKMGGKVGCGQSDMPPRTAAVIPAELFDLLLNREEPFGKGEQLGASLRQSDASALRLEQGKGKLLLEFLNLCRYGRLAYI